MICMLGLNCYITVRFAYIVLADGSLLFFINLQGELMQLFWVLSAFTDIK